MSVEEKFKAKCVNEIAITLRKVDIKRPCLRPFTPKPTALFASLFKKGGPAVDSTSAPPPAAAASAGSQADATTPRLTAVDSTSAPPAAPAAANAGSQEDTTPPRRSPVPCKPNRDFDCPSLLLYDLEDNARTKKTEVYEYIRHRSVCGPAMLYGTSGAGKTRSIYEYLSHNYGLFFVTADHERNAGSGDLMSIFECLVTNPALSEEISDTNLCLIRKRASLLIYVRLLVYKHISTKLGKVRPYEWLLYQLFPVQFLGIDVFHQVVSLCGEIDDLKERQVGSLLSSELMDMDGWESFVPFIDEAQELLYRKQELFPSSTKPGTKRSAFSALLKAFNSITVQVLQVGYPVFSGTDMSLEEFKKQSASLTAKDPEIPLTGPYFAFQDSQALSIEDAESYLCKFLKIEEARPEVRRRVARWLRGRPRFAATFIETYLLRSREASIDHIKTRGRFDDLEDTLMQGLDRYIHGMTTDPSRTSRYSGVGPKSSSSSSSSRGSDATTVFACFKRGAYADDNKPHVPRMKRALCRHVVNVALGGKSGYFRDDTRELIRKGVVAVKVVDEKILGQLDEPLLIEAGMNLYISEGGDCLKEGLQDMLSEKLSESPSDGLGEAFEQLLLGPLLDSGRWQQFLSKDPQLGDSHVFKNYFLSTKSAYGVIARNCKGSITDTFAWVEASVAAKFEGQVPPFCFPDNHCGPDVMAWLYHQKKGKINMKWSTSLTADLQSKWEKLRKVLYPKEGDGKGTQPCLRLMAQYPANATASAVPGVVRDDEAAPKKSGKVHSDDDNCCTKGEECNNRDHDYLVVVSGQNAGEFFTGDTIDAMDSEKPQKKKQKTDNAN